MNSTDVLMIRAARRLAWVSQASRRTPVREAGRKFLLLWRCAASGRSEHWQAFLKVLLALRRDPVVYEWAKKRRAWRLLVGEVARTLRATIATCGHRPMAQLVFGRVVAALAVDQ